MLIPSKNHFIKICVLVYVCSFVVLCMGEQLPAEAKRNIRYSSTEVTSGLSTHQSTSFLYKDTPQWRLYSWHGLIHSQAAFHVDLFPKPLGLIWSQQ